MSISSGKRAPITRMSSQSPQESFPFQGVQHVRFDMGEAQQQVFLMLAELFSSAYR